MMHTRVAPQKSGPGSTSPQLFGNNALSNSYPFLAAIATAATALSHYTWRHRRLLAILVLALAAASFMLQSGRNPACGVNGGGACPVRRVSGGNKLAKGLRTLSMTSYYERWIRKDLERWQYSGITRAMVDAASSPLCNEHKLRFQILNGSLYIDHIHQRSPKGWYPAELGKGWLAAKGRIPYGVLAIMHVLHTYPGQIPDIDAVLQASDHPCIPSVPTKPTDAAAAAALKLLHVSGDPRPPVFSWTHDDDFVDIPFPDFSYWGHDNDRYLGPDIPGKEPGKNWPHGWEAQLAVSLSNSRNMSYSERIPQATWRGRHGPGRDWLRAKFVECPGLLKDANRQPDADLFNLFYPDVRLDLQYQYRYPVYLESEAWATNFKTKLASGSAVLIPSFKHPEFFARDLIPYVHYVPIDVDDLCEDLVTKIKQMNSEVDRHFGMAPVMAPSETTPTSSAMGPSVAASSPSKGTPAPVRGLGWFISAAKAGGKDTVPVASSTNVGSGQNKGLRPKWSVREIKPWVIGDAAQKFLEEHVRMKDVLEYLRDVLRGYSALQIEAPSLSAGSACYTGTRLIEEFSFPHPEDGADVARVYPWLAAWDGGCPKSEYPAKVVQEPKT